VLVPFDGHLKFNHIFLFSRQQRKEIELNAKEKEKRQKLLIKDGDTIEKSWEAQLDTLKKARSNYVKLGKDVALFLIFIS
jgi:hypothetical protein